MSGKINKSEYDAIKNLHKSGLSFLAIAKKYDVSDMTIANIIKYNSNTRAKFVKPNLSDEQIKQIIDLRKKGVSRKRISLMMGVGISKIEHTVRYMNYNNSLDTKQQTPAEPKVIELECKQVEAKSLSQLVASNITKLPTVENLFESRLAKLCDKSIIECNNIFKLISNNKFFANNGKLVIRKQALMATVATDDEWFVDVFSRGWKTIANTITEHLQNEGFSVDKDVNDNSVIVSWA